MDDDNSGVIIINFRESGGHKPMSQIPFKPKHNFAGNNYHYPDSQRPSATYQPAYGKHNKPQYNGGSYANVAYNGGNVGHPQQQFQIEQTQYQGQSGEQQNNDELIKLLGKCLKQCCTVM